MAPSNFENRSRTGMVFSPTPASKIGVNHEIRYSQMLGMQSETYVSNRLPEMVLHTLPTL